MEEKPKKKNIHNSILGIFTLGIITVGAVTFMSTNPDQLGYADASVVKLPDNSTLFLEVIEEEPDTHGENDYEHKLTGNNGIIHRTDSVSDKQFYLDNHPNLDIIWLDNQTVVGINDVGMENESCHVVEVKKGFIESHAIKVGDTFDFNVKLSHE